MNQISAERTLLLELLRSDLRKNLPSSALSQIPKLVTAGSMSGAGNSGSGPSGKQVGCQAVQAGLTNSRAPNKLVDPGTFVEFPVPDIQQVSADWLI